MTGIINWFKTIFILEITGEIALKLVPSKYKEFIAFVMKLILVTAIVIPLLNLKNADISGITDEIKNGFSTYSKENISQTVYDTADKKTAQKAVQEDVAGIVSDYDLEIVSVRCSFTSDMTAVDMINVYVKTGGGDIAGLKADIADRYKISVEQVDIREAGSNG
ncbi:MULTISPECIES: stage III sporulation protein AF [Clostridia]|jgi:hypothetical protein|uniref:stage III sporulation protein AF n=1 Tax=Clostridia TaxID=186801 RepID=UPI000E5D07DF|nr:stage III sporulation protein AF [Eubacterium sp. AF22-9]MCI7771241.1 stage III sporulation protein AF [Eubacterium sp.]RGS32975.1 hypothetical protein DWY02_05500 [Eubacterium sp. AF22-9]HAS05887.1 hypothetical protein [Eubacterium sp.]HCO36065.1 hypothetical protein [Eubacterium sp.]